MHLTVVDETVNEDNGHPYQENGENNLCTTIYVFALAGL
jgi:hypothetical protein